MPYRACQISESFHPDKKPNPFTDSTATLIDYLPFATLELLDDIEACLTSSDTHLQRRLAMAVLLEHFAALHPTSHMRVTVLVARVLAKYESQPVKLNAALIELAVMLQADNLMALIRDAFAAGKVASEKYDNADEVEIELSVLDSSFLNGLQDFMHDKELDELRLELEPLFATEVSEDKLTSVSEFDGFLHAVCASPFPLDSNDWIDEYTPLTSLEEQGEEVQPFRFKLETYFDEVLDKVMQGHPEPYFDSYRPEEKNAQAWASGFLKGLRLWREKDSNALVQHLQDKPTANEIISLLVKMVRGQI